MYFDSEGRFSSKSSKKKKRNVYCVVCGLFCVNCLTAEMSNCFSSPDDSKDEPEFKPAKARGCTDVFWLVVYVVFWLFMVSECKMR